MSLASLFLTAVFLATVSFLFLRVYLPRWLAITVAAIKFTLPVLYFTFVFDLEGSVSAGGQVIVAKAPAFTIKDDVTYYLWSRHVLESGYDPLTILFSQDGMSMLWEPVGGTHVFYYWWNLLAQYLFGPYYHSPVLLNVFLTVIVGVYVTKLLYSLGFSESYSNWFLVFFLLHWDILAWTSVLNLKGTIAMCLAVAYIYHFFRLDQRSTFSWRAVVFHLSIMTGSLILLWWVRFYIIAVLLATTSLWLLYRWVPRYVIPILGLVGTPVAILAVQSVPVFTRFWETAVSRLDPVSLPFGLLKVSLSPRPWGVEPNYLFLEFAAVFHWVAFAAFCYGFARLALEHKPTRYLFVFFGLLVVTFAMSTRFQGARQRYQLVFIIALCQYHTLRLLIAHATTTTEAGYPGQWWQNT
ncbi:hypothetical protein DV733_11210 [Halapricum salinum]|uniref:Glycosyltransferase RgtA/B/C/D-like domain-containing protein n=1 Tax=Halapricum salinum TaxID=1457250 RepID=A0A4D6HG64_9EURY|nr:hypothetical protein DV733_11210 [Halapricum salinum]